uniref:Uncharacterized protein ycf20 n=1 Tax=Leiomenia cribrosa TaxID=217483 RepID=A0A4D6WUX0_9FLOR|nr:hypothetical protein [Leiomenia cribrosa]
MINYLKYISKYELKYISIKLICLLLGFFIATVLSTMPAQTGDSGIIAASIIITCHEILSKIIYNQNNNNIIFWNIINYIKIGIIYGLFVDAFKLGS